MNSGAQSSGAKFGGFRVKLFLAMMVLVASVAGMGLFFAQRSAAADAKRSFQRRFQDEIEALHGVQELRHAMLAERCRTLAKRPRIHAALEDNALDLLYPSARDELADVMVSDSGPPSKSGMHALQATFYRFLDAHGSVIEPSDTKDVGELRRDEVSQIALTGAPGRLQTGYLWRNTDYADQTADEILSMPIVSTENGTVIAAIVLGFRSIDPDASSPDDGLKNGLWLNGRLALPTLEQPADVELTKAVSRAVSANESGTSPAPSGADGSFEITIGGLPHLLFYNRLNPGSVYPPAYEICAFPLDGLIARQRHLAWQFAGAGGLLLIGAFAGSHVLSRGLSRPVEKLAVDSEENRANRQRAETALEFTSEELQRSVRFSADVSHQLKTPVTVLRAGLEELLAGEALAPEMREEVSALVHQTFRLTNVIEDLLLLSRMDSGRLQLRLTSVNLTHLVEAWQDDLGALDDASDLKIETDLPPALAIVAEKRYASLIVQNLLENARKYNRPGGRIRISAREEPGYAVLSIGNTGRPIPTAAQEHIFERFHRGTAGENVPGHGLGLNLARELARLHGGELKLTLSDNDWTEFEVRFRVAPDPRVLPPKSA